MNFVYSMLRVYKGKEWKRKIELKGNGWEKQNWITYCIYASISYIQQRYWSQGKANPPDPEGQESDSYKIYLHLFI